jgi:hypothetical protein
MIKFTTYIQLALAGGWQAQSLRDQFMQHFPIKQSKPL